MRMGPNDPYADGTGMREQWNWVMAGNIGAYPVRPFPQNCYSLSYVGIRSFYALQARCGYDCKRRGEWREEVAQLCWSRRFDQALL